MESETSAKIFDLDIGEILELSGTDYIRANGVSFGACVIGIALTPNGKYRIGHFLPGTIVDELQGLAKLTGKNGVVGVYQSEVEGVVSRLYADARKTGITGVSKSFRNRDEPYRRY